MATTKSPIAPGGFKPGYSWGMIGSAAPVFPGFEVDILDRVSDDEKPDAVWHRERARNILRDHPEVKQLFGFCRWTAIACVTMAGIQLGLAAWTGFLPWWAMLLIAYFLGAPINITLFQLAHECNHRLVFKKTIWNRYLFMLTSLPMFLSGHHTWWVEHIVHHNDMGAKKDFITRRRTFFLATRKTPPLLIPYSFVMLIMQVLRSAFGIVLYVFTSLLRGRLDPTPFTLNVLADEHLASGYRKEGITRWAVIYPVVSFLMCGLLIWLTGSVKPILYLLLSQVFFTGFLHPYCLGWVLGISHFHGRKRFQPTASHYNPLINLTSFNAGLHVEHHDIMGIPWFRLPKLRRMAPEYYDDLQQIKSYTALGLHFVFAGQQSFDDNFNTESYRNAQRFSKGAQAKEQLAEEQET